MKNNLLILKLKKTLLMPKRNSILLILLISFLVYCRGDKSKAKLDHTTALCNNTLFVEVYKIFESGAFGGDRVSQYLTDHTNFRIFIGAFDNRLEFYSYDCKGDSIYVYKGEEHSHKNIIHDTIVYSIADLKRNKKFE